MQFLVAGSYFPESMHYCSIIKAQSTKTVVMFAPDQRQEKITHTMDRGRFGVKISVKAYVVPAWTASLTHEDEDLYPMTEYLQRPSPQVQRTHHATDDSNTHQVSRNVRVEFMLECYL